MKKKKFGLKSVSETESSGDFNAGTIDNDVKYGLILSKTLRIRIILEITLEQLDFLFCFVFPWVSIHFYIVCCRNMLAFIPLLITQPKTALRDLQLICTASKENLIQEWVYFKKNRITKLSNAEQQWK